MTDGYLVGLDNSNNAKLFRALVAMIVLGVFATGGGMILSLREDVSTLKAEIKSIREARERQIVQRDKDYAELKARLQLLEARK